MFRHLQDIDRRVIYLLLLLALGAPLLLRYSVKPARMASAERLFKVVEETKFGPNDIAFIAMDLGPSTKAENGPQAEVIIEHLMRRRIKFAVFSIYYQSEPFLESIPMGVAERLMKEMVGQVWEYGKDWVNLGYRPGADSLIQGIPKSKNLAELFAEDVRGNRLVNLPVFKNVRGLEQIRLLVQVTGLYGVLDSYLQFFQKTDYRPIFVHGCTSITIPEAFIYLDSGQLQGLLEGVAGAAWYSELLKQRFPNRAEDSSRVMNTALGIAHLIIILLIALGNLPGLIGLFHREERA